jgi:hypothetical protein
LIDPHFFDQTVVSNIILRPRPGEAEKAFLPQTSLILAAAEEIRIHTLGFMRKRWLNVRQEGGFDELEGWAVKEISDSR